MATDERKSQAERFKAAARELGCDDDEATFDAKLKKVAGHSAGEPRATKKKRLAKESEK